MRAISLTALALLGLSLTPLAPAQQTVVLGDSLSAEYAGMTTYGAPSGGRRSFNWVEILSALDYDSTLDFGASGFNFDVRLSGYEYNWGVPGAKASDFANAISGGFNSTPYEDLEDHLRGPAERVVIVLGANDFNANYQTFYDGGSPTAFANGIEANYRTILNFIAAVNAQRATPLQVVVGTIIDVGITPDVREDHPDAAKRATATAALQVINARITLVTNEKGFGIVDLFAFSQDIINKGVTVGGERIIVAPSPQNGPDAPANNPHYLFTFDGFHPGTIGQALIGRAIIEAFNTRYAIGASALTDRQILTFAAPRFGPYYTWADSYNLLLDKSPGYDPDGDLLPSAVEYTLNRNPSVRTPVVTTATSTEYALTYTPSGTASAAQALSAETSPGLDTWTDVPAGWIDSSQSPQITIRLPITTGAPSNYLRLHADLFQP